MSPREYHKRAVVCALCGASWKRGEHQCEEALPVAPPLPTEVSVADLRVIARENRRFMRELKLRGRIGTHRRRGE
jgi:hypothetical protein